MQVGELADLLDVELRGNRDVEIIRCSDFRSASNGSLCFVSSRRYLEDLAESAASAVVIPVALASECAIPALISSNPYLTFAKAAKRLHPPAKHEAGIDSTAYIHPDCEIGESVSIAQHVVIDAPCKIASNCYIGPNCTITAPVEFGAGSQLLSNVSICGPVQAGANLLVHPGVVIGSDGFGLANDNGHWLKIPQLGKVIIGDNVEIGANTTIDRGALGDTVIGDGVKIDNQVQVAHNVHIGPHTAIAGCAGIAGSAIIGAHCAIGGGAGIQGHITIVDGVQVTGMTKVSQSISQPGSYTSGTAAEDNQSWLRNALRFKQLDGMFKRLVQLERKLRDKQ